MSPQDPPDAISHIVSQIERDIRFLVAQGKISETGLKTVLSVLHNTSQSAPSSQPVPIPPHPSNIVVVRALWAYNENGEEPDDLSFRAGDTFQVVEETNKDWWKGRINGRECLFPSSYVEKVFSGVQADIKSEKPMYKPFGAAFHGIDAPPLPAQGVNSVGLQQVDQSQKNSKFEGLRSTMAHTAAGGVGFGAGAAIGGGLVRAIF